MTQLTGADPTGATPADAALNTAFAALGPRGGTVELPPGLYSFTDNITYTLPGTCAGVSLIGAGMNATELTWPDGGGLTLNYSSPSHAATVRDLTISTGRAGNGVGLTINQSSPLADFVPTSIVRVLFRGSDGSGGFQPAYWGTGYLFNGVSGSTVDTVTVYGPGTAGVGGLYQGAGPAPNGYSIYHNISKSIFNGLAEGTEYGEFCQGLTISQTNYQNGVTAVSCLANTPGQLSQLNINDCQLSGSGNVISIMTAIGNVTIRGCDIFPGTAGTSGIFLSEAAYATLIGNSVNCVTGSYGIATAGTGVLIKGNIINSALIGALLLPGSSLCREGGNIYNMCATNVDNAGTNNTIGLVT